MAASTQNGTKRPRHVPTGFTAEETQAILAQLHGAPRLMAGLLYGAGLPPMECVRLRVNDIDFAYRQLTVRDGKGVQDRVTMLPQSVQPPLQHHLVFPASTRSIDRRSGIERRHHISQTVLQRP